MGWWASRGVLSLVGIASAQSHTTCIDAFYQKKKEKTTSSVFLCILAYKNGKHMLHKKLANMINLRFLHIHVQNKKRCCLKNLGNFKEQEKRCRQNISGS